MILMGCDFHPSRQQICWLDTATGETGERKLEQALIGRSRPGENRDSDRRIMVAVADRIDGWWNDSTAS
jgi:hypothetical protein